MLLHLYFIGSRILRNGRTIFKKYSMMYEFLYIESTMCTLSDTYHNFRNYPPSYIFLYTCVSSAVPCASKLQIKAMGVLQIIEIYSMTN